MRAPDFAQRRFARPSKTFSDAGTLPGEEGLFEFHHASSGQLAGAKGRAERPPARRRRRVRRGAFPLFEQGGAGGIVRLHPQGVERVHRAREPVRIAICKSHLRRSESVHRARRRIVLQRNGPGGDRIGCAGGRLAGRGENSRNHEHWQRLHADPLPTLKQAPLSAG